ncbi:MAG: hypothetical protein NVS4B8_18900 [Herpetosiphon sp.]
MHRMCTLSSKTCMPRDGRQRRATEEAFIQEWRLGKQQDWQQNACSRTTRFDSATGIRSQR